MPVKQADEIHAGDIFRGKRVCAIYASEVIRGSVVIEYADGAIILPENAEVWVEENVTHAANS